MTQCSHGIVYLAQASICDSTPGGPVPDIGVLATSGIHKPCDADANNRGGTSQVTDSHGLPSALQNIALSPIPVDFDSGFDVFIYWQLT